MGKKVKKLVRDNIPEIIRSGREVPIFRSLEANEFREELGKKLQEEVGEFLAEYSKEELADVLEVIYAFVKYKKFDMGEIEKIRKEKKFKNGGFDKKLYLEYVE